MEIDFHPVTAERWSDFERLFECKGGPHYCWCMAWRVNENRKTVPGKAGLKLSMKGRVENGIPIGLLAYVEGEPIAWCSIAPRETYKSLAGDETKAGVWSIACFFIKRPFRGHGVTRQLLVAAIEYARENRAKYVEAHPVDPDSPSYRFMGLAPMFEQAGFEHVRKAGKRRNVMSLAL